MALSISGNNASAFRLINQLNKIDAEREVTLGRLATGKKINRASDDPAGLIALQSINTQLAGVNAAIDNNQRSKSMLDTVDGALTEVSRLVGEVERLAIASTATGISAAEKSANQAQIDSSIDAIDRIIGNASFNGKKLFNGENRITATLTAADAASIKDVKVHSRNAATGSTALTVNVATAATKGTTSGVSIANITSSLSAATTVSISGKTGSSTVVLGSGSSAAQVVSTINGVKGLTGVSAALSGTELRLDSTDFGSDAFISATAISGDVDLVSTLQVSNKTGTNAEVYVNGQKALTDGTEIHYNGNGISFSANLASNTTGTRTITVTGGGATFQLGTDSASKAVLGLGNVSSGALGRSDLGYLSDLRSGGSAAVNTDASAAVSIAKKATSQIATAAARVGGFSKFQVQSSINALTAAQEGLTATASQIGDADIAAEASKLERQNLLSNAGLSLLSLVNSQQRNVLALLG